MVNGYPAGNGAMLAELARLNQKVAEAGAALASAEARAEAAERGLSEWRECARLAQARADAEALAARKAARTARVGEALAAEASEPPPERVSMRDAVALAAGSAAGPGNAGVEVEHHEIPPALKQQPGMRLRACVAGIAPGNEAFDGIYHWAAGGADDALFPPPPLVPPTPLVARLGSPASKVARHPGALGVPPAPASPKRHASAGSQGPRLERATSSGSRCVVVEGSWANGDVSLDSPGRPPLGDAKVGSRGSPHRELRSSPRGPPVQRERSDHSHGSKLAAEAFLSGPKPSPRARPTRGLMRKSSTRNSVMSECEEHSTMHSVTSQLEEVAVEPSTLEEAQGIIGYYAAEWDRRGSTSSRSNKSSDSVACALCALDLICRTAEGGAMLVMGPNKDLQQLVQHVRTSDDGYMTRRLRGVHISSPEFRETFRLFSAHSDTDRWPEDYEDEEARNLPAEILASNLLHFKVSNGRIIVFDGKDRHHLMKDQPHIANWKTVEQRIVSRDWDEEEVEDIAQLLDGLKGPDGRPVTYLRKCRGHPKDGAIIMSTRGHRLMCAVKIIGLPMARLRWPGVGTRHEAALQLASYLRQCIVFLRSDSGVVHLLCKGRASDHPEVLMVVGALPPAGPLSQAAGDVEGRGTSDEAKPHFMFFSGEQIGSLYELEKTTLGEGGFGSVRRAIHKQTRQPRAVKTMQKSKALQGMDRNMEVDILKAMDHPNITKLVDVFEDYRNVYLVQELYEGGDLFQNILQSGHFTESQAAIAMEQVFCGVQHLHERFVCHRDLKPENFMIARAGPLDEANAVKIIDFGLATFFHPKRRLTKQVGTPHFMAPEVIEGDYANTCDLWSCGVSLYMLLCGRPPFNGRGKAMIFANACQKSVDFSHHQWATVSEEARILTRKLLEKVPEHRLTAEEALHQDWVQQHAPQAEVALPTTFIEDLQRLTKMNAFQRATLHMIASEMKDSDIEGLKAVFNKLDTNKDGTLSMAELHAGLQSVDATCISGLMGSCHGHGDEAIEYAEFIAAALDKRKHLHEDSCWSAFHAFDKNGDGTISQKEIQEVVTHDDFKQAFKGGKVDVECLMREADVDQSGSIEFEEFVRMVRVASEK